MSGFLTGYPKSATSIPVPAQAEVISPCLPAVVQLYIPSICLSQLHRYTLPEDFLMYQTYQRDCFTANYISLEILLLHQRTYGPHGGHLFSASCHRTITLPQVATQLPVTQRFHQCSSSNPTGYSHSSYKTFTKGFNFSSLGCLFMSWTFQLFMYL